MARANAKVSMQENHGQWLLGQPGLHTWVMLTLAVNTWAQ